MKPWKPLLALFCITFATSSATAAIPFRGLLYQSQGASVVDVGADGRLVVSNIGSSGQDGVSIDCLHLDGMRLALDGSCSIADVGASCTLTYFVRLNGLPPGVPYLSTRASFTVSTGHVDLDCDLSALSSSPTQTVTLTRAGARVYSVSVPAGTRVSVAMDALGTCPNPTLSCSVSKPPTPNYAVCYSVNSFSRLVHVSVAGHDDDCDGVEFSAVIDPADQDCDGVSSELRVTSPPGSSFSSVRCSSGECRMFDHFVQGSGQTRIAAIADVHQRGRLSVSNIGSSGQDGVALFSAPVVSIDGSVFVGSSSSRAAIAARFAPPSLSFDPAVDNGASVTLTVIGQSFSTAGLPPTPNYASIQLTMTGSNFAVVCDHSGMGAAVESVAVLSHGVEVARVAMSPGGAVPVSAPPGGPPAFAIASCGKKEFKGHVTLLKAPMFGAGGAGPMASTNTNPYFVENSLQGSMTVSFRCDRIFMVGGLPVVGDELVCWGGSCSSGTCSDGFVASSTQMRVTCPNPASPLSSLSLLDFTNTAGDQVFADVAGTTALSSAHTCVTVPFVFARADSTPVRGYSVRFHLSPELAQCGASVTEGSYLSRVAGTQLFVTSNGGGSFTVDCGILGPVCGATGSGTLFSLDLAAVQPPPSDMGVITVDAVAVRDCSNAPVTASPGGSSYIPIQLTAPPALAGLTASTLKTGNVVGGAIAGIVVAAVLAPSSVAVDLYRKSFGNYPLYDNGASPGHVPTPPATPAAALLSGWKPVTCSSGTCGSGTCGSGACSPGSVLDVPPTRDFFYYVAFVRDLYDNVSAVSSMTPGTLDYHLGDVSNGSATCTGDNHVDILDVSLLGAHYGASVSAGSSFACLDVGPTTTGSVAGRPTTDSKIQFEDFMMFAINYASVSAPSAANRPVAAAMNASRLVVPSLPAVGETFDVGVLVQGAGDMQGLSARLAYDPAVVEQVGVAAGSLLAQQERASSVLSSGPGNVDAALLGAGPGIAGSGEVARVTFRVRTAGDPGLALAGLVARDGSNQSISVTGVSGGAGLPARTSLGFAYPNPFRESIAFQLSLHASGPAVIGIYDVAGRHVRTLVQGAQSAGTRLVTWDGRDDSGLRLAPGAYIVRLEAAGLRESRTVQLVR